ncbi:hypothetical protein, partial [uncultured Ruminococcus sp.]|uniref:hypothetical protein n=1 Tax=uncultured Ruminococcus sp. TaxID=165186 RepID=UPI002625547B
MVSFVLEETQERRTVSGTAFVPNCPFFERSVLQMQEHEQQHSPGAQPAPETSVPPQRPVNP